MRTQGAIAAVLGLAMLGPGTSAFAGPTASVMAAGMLHPEATTSQVVEKVQYRRGGWRGGRGWGGRGIGVGAGIVGGLLLGSALAAPYYGTYYGDRYYTRDYDYYPRADYGYSGGNAVAYCSQRFRSYDPASGTYLGYDGLRHACP